MKHNYNIILICMLLAAGVACDDQEVRLLKYLMDTYDSSVRPAPHFDETLNVTFSLSLHHIIDVDEKNQILTTSCWLTQVWLDHHLKWNESEFGGIKVIRLPFTRIWRPDLILYNSADSQYSSAVINTNVIVTHGGEVTWLSHGIYKSSCDIDVEYFPFDVQTCTLKWASWTYEGYQLDLQITEEDGDVSNYHTNGEFDLLSLRAVRNVRVYSCCPEPYPDVTYTIVMKRRPLFYIFNLIIPCLLINGIALLVFFVPCDSGEKVTLGISALLSMTVFLMTIRESLPPTEKTPLIALYYGVSICIVTFASAMAVVTLNIHHRGFRGIPVPKTLELITLRVLGKILLIQKDSVQLKSEKYQRRRDSGTAQAFQDIHKQLRRLRPAIGHHLDAQSTFRKCDYLDLVNSSPARKSEVTKPTPFVFAGPSSSHRPPPPILVEDFPESRFSSIFEKLNEALEQHELRMKSELKQEELELQWKRVAYVLDRLLFWIFLLSTVVATVLILSSSPYGPNLSE